MPRFHTIVAALDLSDSSADALDAALALASGGGGGRRVHLLHVVPSPAPALWSEDLPPVDLRAVEQAWSDTARAQLTTLAASRALDPAVVAMDVVVGSAAPEILRYAEDRHADVVVLGSHGHGAVRRFLLGSVADKVVRQSGCAVLVVPHRTLRGVPATPSAADRPALP